MIDHVNNLKLQHLVELSKLGGACAEIEQRICGSLAERHVVYDDEAIPFVLMPHFVSPGQQRRIRHAVAVLVRVLERFCEAYGRDEALREELALPAREDALIRIDPGYPQAIRVCRLDALMQGYELRFIEFNTDSPAGLGYTDALAEILTEAIELPHVQTEFETSYTPILPELFATLLDAYGHVRARHADLPEAPRLAIVDRADAPTARELRIVCAAARDAGIEAVHGTLDELSYDGSLLHLRGEPVHLVSRRALVDDVDDDGALVAAMRDGRACVVNPFRALVANTKKLLALLADPRFAHLVEKDEADVVRRTIPWTRILRPGRVTYGDWLVDLLPFVSDNRERLVLKPGSDYGGHGVALGMETGQSEWDGLIAEHAEGGTYVVQEYVPIPEEMFPTVQDGQVHMRLKRFNINPFGLGGRYAGMITRISDRAVINVSAGGGLLPSVVGRHKRHLLAEVEEEAEPATNAI